MSVGLPVDGCEMEPDGLQGARLLPCGWTSKLQTCSTCPAPFYRVWKKTQGWVFQVNHPRKYLWVSRGRIPAFKILTLFHCYLKQVLDVFYRKSPLLNVRLSPSNFLVSIMLFARNSNAGSLLFFRSIESSVNLKSGPGNRFFQYMLETVVGWCVFSICVCHLDKC